MDDCSARLRWPDVAKGGCILLVVLHHVTGKQYGMVVPTGFGAVEDAWLWVTAALKPIRMPLFFVVSGFFAAGAMGRPWAVVRRRIVNPYYLYVVWLVIFAGVYSVERTLPANRTDGLLDFLTELGWAATSMWFLFALAAYFGAAKALRGVPAPLVLAVAAGVALTTSWLPLHETNRVAVLTHFGYFAFGAYYPHLLRRLAEVRLPLLALLTSYVVLTLALEAVGARLSIRLLVLSLVGIPLGIGVAVRIARVPWCSAGLAWLGRRTLQVYVLHMAVLAVVAHLSLSTDVGWGPGTALLTAGYPLLMTGLVAVACLGLHRVLVTSGAGFLFSAPVALLDGARRVGHDPSGDPARPARHRGPGRPGADGRLQRQRAGGRGLRGRRARVAAVRHAHPGAGPGRGGRDPGGHGAAVQPQLLLPR